MCGVHIQYWTRQSTRPNIQELASKFFPWSLSEPIPSPTLSSTLSFCGLRGRHLVWVSPIPLATSRGRAGQRPSDAGPGPQRSTGLLKYLGPAGCRGQGPGWGRSLKPRVLSGGRVPPSPGLGLSLLESGCEPLPFYASGINLQGVCDSKPHMVTFLQFQVHLRLGKYLLLGEDSARILHFIRPFRRTRAGLPSRSPRASTIARTISYFNVDVTLN